MSLTRAARFGFSATAVLALVALTALPAAAQDPAPVVVVTGAIDVTNQYNFRGIRQTTEGVSIQPYVDFGLTPYMGEGGLKALTLNFGTWNAFNTQIDDNKWYESDLYATVGFGFSKASLSLNYTSYTSPADLFAHVKELGVKLGVDDSAALGKGALKPYVLLAFELDDAAQADGGAAKGKYLEIGIAPGYSGSKASLAVPVKVGLSAGDYYEFGGDDSTFGYFSVAGLVTVPINAHANVHFGLEVQAFGDSVKAYNDQDAAAIGSFGLGFSF